MNWTNLGEFAAMGGYGLYVWGSFGVAAIVMWGEVLALRGRRKALRAAETEAHPPPHAGYREGTA